MSLLIFAGYALVAFLTLPAAWRVIHEAMEEDGPIDGLFDEYFCAFLALFFSMLWPLTFLLSWVRKQGSKAMKERAR